MKSIISIYEGIFDKKNVKDVGKNIKDLFKTPKVSDFEKIGSKYRIIWECEYFMEHIFQKKISKIDPQSIKTTAGIRILLTPARNGVPPLIEFAYFDKNENRAKTFFRSWVMKYPNKEYTPKEQVILFFETIKNDSKKCDNWFRYINNNGTETYLFEFIE